MRFGQENNDDDQEDIDHYFNDDFDDHDDMMHDDMIMAQQDREIKMVELNLVEANLNRRILVGVVKMLESSFFWRFTSHDKRLKMISESYKTFSKLIAGQEDEIK